jgi:GrpB-like predicted nucleotidyltransferase (UPF0157 family)
MQSLIQQSDSDYKRSVIVVPYDPNWPKEFEKIHADIWPAIQHSAQRIEHVGSTSVPGLAAKPVIDLDVVIATTQDFPAVKAALESLGYYHNGDQGIPGREAFKYDPTQKPGLMCHHLYVCAADSAELKRHLTLRDHLRNHSDDRDAYAAAKFSAAQSHPNDIDGYIEAKGPVIRAILENYNLNDPISVLANAYALRPIRCLRVSKDVVKEILKVAAEEGEYLLVIYKQEDKNANSYLAPEDTSNTHYKLVQTHNGIDFLEDDDRYYQLYQAILRE